MKKYNIILILILCCSFKFISCGLINPGCKNSTGVDCFMNASVQALFHTTALRNFIENNKKLIAPNTSSSLFITHIDTLSKANEAISVDDFRAAITKDNEIKHMQRGQHDAPEFVQFIINKLKYDSIYFNDLIKLMLQPIQNIADQNSNVKALLKTITLTFLYQDINESNFIKTFNDILIQQQAINLNKIFSKLIIDSYEKLIVINKSKKLGLLSKEETDQIRKDFKLDSILENLIEIKKKSDLIKETKESEKYIKLKKLFDKQNPLKVIMFIRRLFREKDKLYNYTIKISNALKFITNEESRQDFFKKVIAIFGNGYAAYDFLAFLYRQDTDNTLPTDSINQIINKLHTYNAKKITTKINEVKSFADTIAHIFNITFKIFKVAPLTGSELYVETLQETIVRTVVDKKNQSLEQLLEKTFTKILPADKALLDQTTYLPLVTYQKKIITQAPEVLIIHIGRADDQGNKSNHQITFPLYLNLEEYSPEPLFYSLFAIILHDGETINSGHYRAYAQWKQQWGYYNDSFVEEKDDDFILKIADQEQEKGKPYLLFYKKEKEEEVRDKWEKQEEERKKKEAETEAEKKRQEQLVPSLKKTLESLMNKLSLLGEKITVLLYK